jgi:hypothetical protein
MSVVEIEIELSAEILESVPPELLVEHNYGDAIFPVSWTKRLGRSRCGSTTMQVALSLFCLAWKDGMGKPVKAHSDAMARSDQPRRGATRSKEARAPRADYGQAQGETPLARPPLAASGRR